MWVKSGDIRCPATSVARKDNPEPSRSLAAPGVRNEHVPTPKGKMCSELCGNVETVAETTIALVMLSQGVTDCNNCTDGNMIRPAAILSDQNTFEYYNKTNTALVRYVDQRNETGDLTFRGLEYQGIPWYWDRQCPAGTMYFVNPEFIHFRTDPRYRFKWTAPLTYPDQLAYTRICATRLVLCTTSRMFLGVITGWTA